MGLVEVQSLISWDHFSIVRAFEYALPFFDIRPALCGLSATSRSNLRVLGLSGLFFLFRPVLAIGLAFTFWWVRPSQSVT